MSDQDKPSLSEAIRLLAERDRRSLGAHPKIEELAAYHAGELEPRDEARVRDHIAVCRECSDLLLDLINFSDLTPPPGEPDLTDEEMEEDWQALRARMGMGKAEEPKQGAEVVPMIRPAPTAPAPSVGRTYSPLLPIAASLLAVLGFSFGLYQSHRAGEAYKKLEEGREPYVAEAVNAELGDSTTRGELKPAVEQSTRISSEQGGVVFVYPDEDGQEYQVEISRDGKVRWRSRATLVREGQSMEGIPVVLPGGYLEPGRYTLRLLKGDGAAEKQGVLKVDD